MDVPAFVEVYLDDQLPAQALDEPLPDDVAEEVVERLKAEADRQWGTNPSRSLELAGRIIAIGERRGDPRQAALGWMARGDALKFLGQTAEAWEALERAGAMFAGSGDEVGWARTRIGRLYMSTMLRCVPQALAEAERAREIFIRYADRDKLLRLDFQTAYVYNYMGEAQKALELYRQALRVAEELGEAGEAYYGPLYVNMGSAYEALGELRQAEEFYQRAYAILERRGEKLTLATVETNLAYLAQAQGSYRRALRLLSHALEAAGEESELESTKIKGHLLECYLGLRRLEEARELARQVIDELRELDDAFELGRTLLQLATVEAELGDFEPALTALEEAEGIFGNLGAAAWTATAWLRGGRIALLRGDSAAAHRKASEALAVFHSASQHVDEAAAALLQGQALLALGEAAEAAAAGRIALRTAQRDGVPSLRYTAHLLLGQVSEARSSLSRARRHYQAAAATTERVQRGLTITLQPGFLEEKAEAWRALIALHLRQAGVAEAFESLERAKSQVLYGYLANRERLRWAQDDLRSRRLIEELDALRAEHQWFYRLAHEAASEPDGSRPVEPQQALKEVAARERRMRLITEELYLRSAEGRAVNARQAPCTAEMREALDSDTLLVEYYNDGAWLWAFTLDRNSIEVQRLPIASGTLQGLLSQLQANLAAALKIEPEAAAAASLARLAQRILGRLYEGLLAPLAGRHEGKGRLVIVPYGALHFLPFHLLHDGSSYLIERHETVILPAAGLALQPGPRRGPGALALAHSWDGRLPHTRREAELVQALFGGALRADAEANRLAFREPPGQILHIAAHGKYRLDQPDLSYIQLADGQLYADDLLQQDLSYELVTLSACETGRANVSGADEPIGLGRGFLYAGAGALLLSLWPVPDLITLRLMESVYRALRDGASKAAALREAQRAVLAETPELHPAFWGAFQLVGDAGPLSGQGTKDDGR